MNQYDENRTQVYGVHFASVLKFSRQWEIDIFSTHMVIQFLGTAHAQNQNQENSTSKQIALNHSFLKLRTHRHE